MAWKLATSCLQLAFSVSIFIAIFSSSVLPPSMSPEDPALVSTFPVFTKLSKAVKSSAFPSVSAMPAKDLRSSLVTRSQSTGTPYSRNGSSFLPVRRSGRVGSFPELLQSAAFNGPMFESICSELHQWRSIIWLLFCCTVRVDTIFFWACCARACSTMNFSTSAAVSFLSIASGFCLR